MQSYKYIEPVFNQITDKYIVFTLLDHAYDLEDDKFVRNKYNRKYIALNIEKYDIQNIPDEYIIKKLNKLYKLQYEGYNPDTDEIYEIDVTQEYLSIIKSFIIIYLKQNRRYKTTKSARY